MVDGKVKLIIQSFRNDLRHFIFKHFKFPENILANHKKA